MELVGKRILIVDDEPLFLQTTGQLLRKEGAECQTATDASSALEALEHGQFDLILTDLNMPGNLQWELLKTGREQWSDVPMIVITGVPTLPSAIESLRLGVTDYLLKPVGFPELLTSVRRSLSTRVSSTPQPETGSLEESRDVGLDRDVLIGDSPAMLELRATIERVSRSNAHVLITGATGTGKELVARVIHQQSPRSAHSFAVVDCNAHETESLAINLFGSAYPGQPAVPGLLSKTHQGSVYLDEVAELPFEFQPKLLRVVQSQEVTPLGSTTALPIDVRFIASTQRQMSAEIAAGRFRQDLYYRLRVISLTVPPLCQRDQDVLLLAQHFWETGAPGSQPRLQLSQSAKEALLAYQWPGNVRELRNVIQRAITFSTDGKVTLDELPAEISHSTNPSPAVTNMVVQPAGSDENLGQITAQANADVTLHEHRTELERAYLLELIESSRGNVTQAARKARMSRQGFHKLLKRHGLSASKFRS